VRSISVTHEGDFCLANSLVNAVTLVDPGQNLEMRSRTSHRSQEGGEITQMINP